MGACVSVPTKGNNLIFSNPSNLKIQSFKMLKAIGRGGFGKVYIVEKGGE